MKLHLAWCFRQSILTLVLFVLHGCAGMSPDEQQAKRAELDEMGENAIAALLETRPEAREALDQAVGYAVVDMAVTKIPVFGAGGGLGVIVDKGYRAFKIVEGGAVATVTIRLARATPYLKQPER